MKLTAALLLPAMALPALANDAADALAALKERMTVYRNEDTLVQRVKLSWMEQVQVAAVQPCGGNGHKLRDGASPFDADVRRSWLGADVDFRTGTHFSGIARVGGLPHRYRYENGRTRKDYSYTDIYEIWVKQDLFTRRVTGLSLKLGKVSPLFTTDYLTSASKIDCVERSIMGGPQYGLDSNWGAELIYAPNDRSTLFLQLLANDRASDDKDNGNPDAYRDGRGAKGEFGWEDKFFALIGGDHRFAVTEAGHHKLALQYAHDFDNGYDNGTEPGANYFGMNVKDALSLGHEWKRDALTLNTNIIANAEMRHAGGSGNNIGWQVQPVYSLTPHTDLVFRYLGMTGHDAVKLGADRYITRHTDSPKWVDSLHSVYLGVNFFLSAEDKHAAKLMFGAEYLHARKQGQTAYCGTEFTAALRWNL